MSTLLDLFHPFIVMGAVIIVLGNLYHYGVQANASQRGGVYVVEYSWQLKLFAVAIALVVAFVDYAAAHACPSQLFVATIVASLFTVGGAHLLLDAFFTRITFDESGIRVWSTLRRGMKLRWDEVTDGDWWPVLQVHAICTTRGRILLSPMISGLADFLPRVLRHLAQRNPERYAATAHAIENAKEIKRSSHCGCFHCLAIFPATEVTNWLDQDGTIETRTAICPRCEYDTLIGDASGLQIDTALLNRLHARHFGPPSAAGRN